MPLTRFASEIASSLRSPFGPAPHDSTMRVLQINSVHGNGSTGRIAVTLHRALLARGDQSWVAYGRGVPPASPDAIRIGSRAEVLAHVALTRLLDRHGLGSRRATRNFLEVMEQLDPDVVHLHNIHGYYLNFEVLFEYLKRSGRPVVWTLHDAWSFTGHCAHFDFVQCSKWLASCGDCVQRRRYPASWLRDFSREMLERKRAAFSGVSGLTVVTPSTWLARIARRSFLGQYQIEVVPNGIDQSVFTPRSSQDVRARYGIAFNADVVLAVAADFRNPRKGFQYVVELATALEGDAVVVALGLPHHGSRGLPAGMIAIPRIEDVTELAALYATASAFVNPTLEDTFPTVTLEALACGTPVVTFDSGGSAEQVGAGTGFVVAKGDRKAFANVTRDVLRRGRSAFSGRCRTHAERFSAERMINAYLDLYSAAEHQGRGADPVARETRT